MQFTFIRTIHDTFCRQGRARHRRRTRHRACNRKTFFGRGLARGIARYRGQAAARRRGRTRVPGPHACALVRRCGQRRGRIRDRDAFEPVRPARRAGQQCRRCGVHAAARNHRRGLEPGACGQPDRTVPLHQGSRSADARAWRRRRQHHLDLGTPRLHAAVRLRHQQSGPCASDKTARRRARLVQYPRQWRGTRTGRHRDGQGGALGRDPRRLSRRDPAQPLRPGRGARGSHLLPELRTFQLHHGADPGGRWRLRCRRHRPQNAARCAAERTGPCGHRAYGSSPA
jgi:hypothetical protein